MKKLILFLVVGNTFIMLQSCATVVHGTKQKIGINSVPSGAKVEISNHYPEDLLTPCFADLKRNQNYMVKIHKEGYKDVTVPVTSSLAPETAGNCCVGGIIGGAIDVGSGGAYQLNPNIINVKLEPFERVEEPKKNNILVTKDDAVFEGKIEVKTDTHVIFRTTDGKLHKFTWEEIEIIK